MKRTTLMVAAAGVVLAATGATIGVAASGASSPAQPTSLVADDSSTPSPETFPSELSPSELSPSESETPTPGQSSMDDSPPPAKAKGRISADRAAEIALARAGGRVTDIEAEFEHGRPVWKVELVTGGVEYRVDVDRETGAIVRFRLEDGDRGGSDDRHGDDNSGSGSGSGDDNSGSGSSGHGGDNSGRDHPEDD